MWPEAIWDKIFLQHILKTVTPELDQTALIPQRLLTWAWLDIFLPRYVNMTLKPKQNTSFISFGASIYNLKPLKCFHCSFYNLCKFSGEIEMHTILVPARLKILNTSGIFPEWVNIISFYLNGPILRFILCKNTASNTNEDSRDASFTFQWDDASSFVGTDELFIMA